ncbi:MAG: hypothetical protein H0W64_00605 [Gammaproteobacteria bacterium]|nr:hypothetical protein [Gammaproteobacteria bacterium]
MHHHRHRLSDQPKVQDRAPQEQANDLFKDLYNLHTQFLMIDSAFKLDKSLRDELTLFRTNQCRLISSALNYHFKEFNSLCEKYTNIKNKLVDHGIFSAEDIQNVEVKIIKAADPRLNNLGQLLFFPEYQNLYDHDHQRATLIDKKNQINQGYQARTTTYQRWEYNTGIASIIALGIPFILAPLLVHAIDKLLTHLKLWKLNHQIKVVEGPLRKKLDEEISKDPEKKTKQQFFQLAKTRLTDPLNLKPPREESDKIYRH